MYNLLAAAPAAGGSPLAGLLVPVIFLVVFYFLVIRPQKKREKEITEMRDALKVGDIVITIGGIKGKILKVGEDYITLESGPDKAKMELTRWAVGVNETQSNKDK